MATIENNTTNTIISGTDLNDNIHNLGLGVSINGGAGDDLISLGSYAENNTMFYTSGNGNDTILGFKTHSTLQIGDGTDTYATVKSDSDIIVAVGDGLIFLKDAASLSTVNIAGMYRAIPFVIGTDDNDTISNNVEEAMIQALDGNDSIQNCMVYSNRRYYGGSNVTIFGGRGDDSIQNGGYWNGDWHYSGNNVMISGGAGNDSIKNGFVDYGHDSTMIGGDGDDTIDNGIDCYNSSISGGAGNDSIKNSSSNVTIDAGEGKDIIENSGGEVIINGDDGDDTISNGYQSGGAKSSISGGNGNVRSFFRQKIYRLYIGSSRD